MPHEIDRVLGAVSGSLWMIDPAKGVEIVHALALRAAGEPSDWQGDPAPKVAMAEAHGGQGGVVHLLRLHGSIMPRSGNMSRMSGGVSMESFSRAFAAAAADPQARAIVIDIDSPGGMVDLVPETAAMIHKARRADRPIIAQANTLAASAAYYIAAAADEIAVTPSGQVGSIGVYTVHDDLSVQLEQRGVRKTVIHEGARKVEAAPFGPLSDEARAALQANVAATYAAFTADVAKFRGVPVATVRADPEKGEAHFGGGRVYHAREAVRLGMADRVATLDETLARALRGVRRPPSTRTARARLALI